MSGDKNSSGARPGFGGELPRSSRAEPVVYISARDVPCINGELPEFNFTVSPDGRLLGGDVRYNLPGNTNNRLVVMAEEAESYINTIIGQQIEGNVDVARLAESNAFAARPVLPIQPIEGASASTEPEAMDEELLFALRISFQEQGMNAEESELRAREILNPQAATTVSNAQSRPVSPAAIDQSKGNIKR